MQHLPQELVMEILLHVPIENLQSFCSSSKEISVICDDEYFWRRRLGKDYPRFKDSVPSYGTYKHLYKLVYNTGIGEKLLPSLKIETLKPMMFIEPKAPYGIEIISWLHATEIGYVDKIYLQQDIMIMPGKENNRFTGVWRSYKFPRTSNVSERDASYRKRLGNITTEDDLINVVTDLFKNGYYQLDDNYLSNEKYDELQTKGMVGYITEKTIL